MPAFPPTGPDHALMQAVYDQYPPPIKAVYQLVMFLQERFGKLPVGAYHWEREGEGEGGTSQSEIYISADTPLPGQAIGMRPAITVLRSQIQFQGLGIGDLAYHDWQTGGKLRQDLVPTTLVINVLSRLAFVAERLAFFVHDQIFTLREEIMRREKCIQYLGSRISIAPPAPAPPTLVEQVESDWQVVALLVPAWLQWRSSFEPINVPILQGVDIKPTNNS